MQRDLTATILDEYSNQHGLYTDFSRSLEGLLQEFLKQNGIRVHSIVSRVKDRNSLQGKLNRVEGKYARLSDITDIVGIRIITYFEDEVDAVADIVEREFQLDMQNSVDKRTLLDPDRFGYLSLHYVVGLPEKRLELTEYKRFAGCRAEIQIRSILQHTWAEIEHDLGYKPKQAIPKEIRRSFSRLAGLLEIADLEFTKIRHSLEAYENEVEQQIQTTPTEVLIDQVSLKSYIENSARVFELDQQIAHLAGADVVINERFIGMMVERLHYFDLKTISDLEAVLAERGEMLLRFAAYWIRKNARVEAVGVGVCLFYLCYVLAGSQQSADAVLQYLQSQRLGDPSSREAQAQEILAICHQLSLPGGDL